MTFSYLTYIHINSTLWIDDSFIKVNRNISTGLNENSLHYVLVSSNFDLTLDFVLF